MMPRYNLARREARKLLAAANIREPSVPVKDLARMVGAVLRIEPFKGDLSGVAHRRPDGRVLIGVNALDRPTRQRFTIAHEIGHLILHKDKQLHVDHSFSLNRDSRSSTAEDVTEIEANQFAAELIMPESMLVCDMANAAFDIEGDDAVCELASKYDVSVHAMTVRITTLKRRR